MQSEDERETAWACFGNAYKNLNSMQNRRQKIFNKGGFTFVQWG